MRLPLPAEKLWSLISHGHNYNLTALYMQCVSFLGSFNENINEILKKCHDSKPPQKALFVINFLQID